jgi:uncharacterized protein YcbK (DUF882 family)
MRTETKIAVAVFAAILIYYIAKTGRYFMNREFKYFSWSEFDSPDYPGSGKKFMSRDFIEKLDRVRARAGFPFIINSGYRTGAHNAKVGGSPNSSHKKGLAVDISAPFDWQKEAIAKAAIAEGITRIGWGRTFVHLDVDQDKTQNIVWGYGNGNPSFEELENLA